MKVSVCMATYNGAEYINEQIYSILKQLSYQDELIISDDGSTDNTIDIIKNIHDNRINKIINTIKPDYIILDSHLLSYFWSAFKYRKKSLLIVHDPFFHSGENFFIERMQRKFYFSFLKNKMLFNKAQKKDFIRFYGQENNKIFTSFLSIYEYILAHNNPKDNDEVNSNFNVLFFGRISPYKGIKYLLDAFVDILESKKINNISLTIAGSGEFDFDISLYNKYPEIDIINKYINPRHLAEIIYNSSVVVCPYLDATQSGVVMTSFALKKPVIATRVGGLEEMVTDHKTGFLINKKNVNDIKESILKLYNNPELLKEMSENIYKEYHIGEKSWDKSADFFIKAFEAIN